MIFQNNNTQVLGSVVNDYMVGKCKVILDGQFEQEAYFEEGKMLVSEPGKFFNCIDNLVRNNPQELEPNKLNGY